MDQKEQEIGFSEFDLLQIGPEPRLLQGVEMLQLRGDELHLEGQQVASTRTRQPRGADSLEELAKTEPSD